MFASVRLHLAIAALGFLLGAPLAAQAPADWNARQFQMTRADLQALLERYELVLESPGYSGDLKNDARRSAELIRERLDRGDFRTGDRIVLDVEGMEEALPDTLLVGQGPAIDLPGIGAISLLGVLRSELQDHLTAELGRFVRTPDVTARSLIRLSLQGQVGRPGFYVFPSEMLLGDIIMEAGGPSAGANLEEVTIQRGSEVILEAAETREALNEGRSLDQLGLQAGDQVVIPEETQSNIWGQVARVAAVALSTLLLGVRIF